MEPKFQSTFIPRGPMAPSSAAAISKEAKHGGFIGFIAFLIFLFSIIGSIGVYGYEKYLTSHIGKIGDDLEKARQSLEADAINQVTNLNSRLDATEKILDNHNIVSPVFDFLEKNTLKTVRFTDFKFNSTSEGIKVTFHGQARGYSALSLQADQFNKSKYVRNPIFSDLTLDDKGNVIFAFSGDLDPSIISYKNQVQIPDATITAPISVSTSTSTTTPNSSTSTTPR